MMFLMYLTIIYHLILSLMYIELEELEELEKKVIAVSIVTPHEFRMLQKIENLLEQT